MNHTRIYKNGPVPSPISGFQFNMLGDGLFDVNSFNSTLSMLDRKSCVKPLIVKPSVKLLPLSDRRSTLGKISSSLVPFDSIITASSDAGSVFLNRKVSDDSSASSTFENASFIGNCQNRSLSDAILSSTVYTTGLPRPEITLQEIIQSGQLFKFANDRLGVKILETNYPRDENNEMHKIVFQKLTESTTLFTSLCHNPNGNFIVQKLVEFATIPEQKFLLHKLVESGLMEICKNKFACRIVQLAIQKFDRTNVTELLTFFSTSNLIAICTDQSASHVIQRIVKSLPVEMWKFFVQFLYSGDNLMAVCQDKYGCRLVQLVIDKLAENPKFPCFPFRLQLLHSLMTCVVRNCYRLSSNEFANYVVQYAIKSSGVMEMYRDIIIEKCLLRNLLSMSQDKYASHVIEGAFFFAPPTLLSEMMDEIFDGYMKDQYSNRDALDILLFHQYGNYVVQQVILICTSALMGKEERQLTPSELSMYAMWYEKIRNRVYQHSSRLERFSSGKKIIDSLMKFPALGSSSVQKPTVSLLELSTQFDNLFPSFLNNSMML